MSDSLLPSLRACQDPLWQSLNNTMKPFVHPQLTHTITRVSVPLCFIVWLVYFTSWNINIVQGTTCPRVECFHQSKFWVGIFKSQSYTSKVSTTGVSDKGRQWSNLGPIQKVPRLLIWLHGLICKAIHWAAVDLLEEVGRESFEGCRPQLALWTFNGQNPLRFLHPFQVDWALKRGAE